MNEQETAAFTAALIQASPVSLERAQLDVMTKFCSLLLEKNAVMNLTAVKDPAAAAVLHFADSLHILDCGMPTGRVLDVGSGGGFPALPVAVCSAAEVTALDATAKKLTFILEAARECGVTNLNTLCGRAEELSRDLQYRDGFDTVMSRGVARLNVLCEWCMPFVRVGGRFIAMKGSRGREELDEAQNAIRLLGGEVEDVKSYTLPGDNREYTLISVSKVRATPDEYPRHNSKIERKPL